MYQVSDMKISHGVLYLNVDGTEIEKELKQISPTLAKALSTEQSAFEVSPSGYGIHWPRINEASEAVPRTFMIHHRALVKRS
uniref:DUF2442 domain-containing protein n=1 Tax=Candidatus Kentrum sp. LPFa TaxID=2126335 RepID=A0A450X976_9GAMM|nr:MAG: Protein of unknown function (DUF2442) [Candidatus Kentron sp. LPFa]